MSTSDVTKRLQRVYTRAADLFSEWKGLQVVEAAFGNSLEVGFFREDLFQNQSWPSMAMQLACRVKRL